MKMNEKTLIETARDGGLLSVVYFEYEMHKMGLIKYRRPTKWKRVKSQITRLWRRP